MQDRNGAAQATAYEWAPTADLLLKRTAPLGRVSTTVYDRAGRPTDTYGPGTAGEFAGSTSTTAPHAAVAPFGECRSICLAAGSSAYGTLVSLCTDWTRRERRPSSGGSGSAPPE